VRAHAEPAQCRARRLRARGAAAARHVPIRAAGEAAKERGQGESARLGSHDQSIEGGRGEASLPGTHRCLYVSLSLSIYIYVYIYMCVYIPIYINYIFTIYIVYVYI